MAESEYNGRVKCVKAYIAYADNGVLRDYFLSTEEHFDEMGNQTYNYWYNGGEKYVSNLKLDLPLIFVANIKFRKYGERKENVPITDFAWFSF